MRVVHMDDVGSKRAHDPVKDRDEIVLGLCDTVPTPSFNRQQALNRQVRTAGHANPRALLVALSHGDPASETKDLMSPRSEPVSKVLHVALDTTEGWRIGM